MSLVSGWLLKEFPICNRIPYFTFLFLSSKLGQLETTNSRTESYCLLKLFVLAILQFSCKLVLQALPA